jgi:hypothetical protein
MILIIGKTWDSSYRLYIEDISKGMDFFHAIRVAAIAAGYTVPELRLVVPVIDSFMQEECIRAYHALLNITPALQRTMSPLHIHWLRGLTQCLFLGTRGCVVYEVSLYDNMSLHDEEMIAQINGVGDDIAATHIYTGVDEDVAS